MTSVARWTVEPGRWLYLDGKPYVALHRDHGAASPTDADKLAHIVCKLLNEAGEG